MVKTTIEKGHGRIETRTYVASAKVDWIGSDRSYPGQRRFDTISTLLMVQIAPNMQAAPFSKPAPTSPRLRSTSSASQRAFAATGASKACIGILDVEFADDLSRYRAGHGAKNMAVVRRFALGLVRANKTKGSIKTHRKAADWNPQFLLKSFS